MQVLSREDFKLLLDAGEEQLPTMGKSYDGERRTVSATFRCRLVVGQNKQTAGSSASNSMTSIFSHGQPKDMYLTSRTYASDHGFVQPDDSLLIECAITVLLEAPVNATAVAAALPTSVPAPLSDLQKHLGEMLTSKNGADITFLVSGESVAAHRCVLAARSPVFMAELFGHMKEKESQCIEIKDMETEVFRTMLHFIYTDTLPEQDDDDEAETMAYGLLEAADRYGIERLKLICAEKMHAHISVHTAGMALALAERHGCTKLKARCIEFILASQENFHAVAATEGYKLLMDSCPSALNDLLVAVFLRHFGEMLTSKKGTDITFLDSGEPVTVHRYVLAARSPVFMAKLFGDMKDMEAEVFKALLHFIYTDTLSEHTDDDEAQTMAHHLLEVADRYGMERLKLICAEAERHGCTKLKAGCIEFMVACNAPIFTWL
uniref:BTB domain-containing protein n=1 Tax=Oryza punctata TaxID=4537 RepID=A0A0E0LEG9_ORYPU